MNKDKTLKEELNDALKEFKDAVISLNYAGIRLNTVLKEINPEYQILDSVCKVSASLDDFANTIKDITEEIK